jgi:hypothetical protein
VVFRTGAIEAGATAARRAQLRTVRHRVRLEAAAGVESVRGRSIRVDEATAATLGVTAGAVVELVNPRGAPLRAWVVGLLAGNGRRAEIAPEALGMLALIDGAEVEIRALHSGTLARS